MIERGELPILYGIDSKGRTKTWTGYAYENTDKTAGYKTFAGLKDGKLAESEKKIKVGKHLGKSNETSPYEQAILELTSKATKKKDQEGYAEDEKGLVIPRLPMLAKNLKDRKEKIEYSVYCQAKLDGIRVFAEKINGDTIRYTSRKGKPITTLNHITPHLLEIMEIDEIFDGEIYTPALSFQEICAATKKERENSLKLELWVYDVANEELDFEDRYKRYFSAIKVKSYEKVSAPVKAVESILVHNEEEIENAHREFVSQNFEGLICRARAGGYEFKKRSDRLLKLKSFDDGEFLVTGGYQGTGSATGHVTFLCKTSDNKEFGCVPRGNHEHRAFLWKNLDKIVEANAYITVRYFGLTNDGIPRFPVGLEFREGGINKDGVFEPNL